MRTEENIRGQKTYRATGSGAVSRYEAARIRQRSELAAGRRKADREFRIEQNIKAQHNGARAFSLAQLIVIAVAAVAILCSAVMIVYCESVLHTTVSTVNNRRIALETLIEENRDLEAQINAEVDVVQIRQRAERLGLHIPSGKQVISYRKAESERVIQNEDIPEP